MFSVKYPPTKIKKGFKDKKEAAKWIQDNLKGRQKMDATIVKESSMEDFVESVLYEIDAKTAASKMDSVMSSINDLSRVISRDRNLSKMVRSLEEQAKRISVEINKRM